MMICVAIYGRIFFYDVNLKSFIDEYFWLSFCDICQSIFLQVCRWFPFWAKFKLRILNRTETVKKFHSSAGNHSGSCSCYSKSGKQFTKCVRKSCLFLQNLDIPGKHFDQTCIHPGDLASLIHSSCESLLLRQWKKLARLFNRWNIDVIGSIWIAKRQDIFFLSKNQTAKIKLDIVGNSMQFWFERSHAHTWIA